MCWFKYLATDYNEHEGHKGNFLHSWAKVASAECSHRQQKICWLPAPDDNPAQTQKASLTFSVYGQQYKMQNATIYMRDTSINKPEIVYFAVEFHSRMIL